MTEQQPPFAPRPLREAEALGVSGQPCPRCGQLLNWSTIHPPKIEFDGITGFVSHIDLERWCICGYVEAGFINIDRQPIWTEVIQDETLSVEQEVKERARLASQWLLAGLTSYQVDPIDWQQAGLQAAVVIEGVQVGTLLDVYNHFRGRDDFYPWLRSQIDKSDVGQARAYLAAQGFYPRREEQGWCIRYPKTGREVVLTNEGLCKEAKEVKAYRNLHPVLQSNPTIGTSHD